MAVPGGSLDLKRMINNQVLQMTRTEDAWAKISGHQQAVPPRHDPMQIGATMRVTVIAFIIIAITRLFSLAQLVEVSPGVSAREMRL